MIVQGPLGYILRLLPVEVGRANFGSRAGGFGLVLSVEDPPNGGGGPLGVPGRNRCAVEAPKQDGAATAGLGIDFAEPSEPPFRPWVEPTPMPSGHENCLIFEGSDPRTSWVSASTGECRFDVNPLVASAPGKA